MQQRVGLARALAVEPSILLMDEPFGSVDDQTRMLLQDELLEIWEEDQKTVIFVTHDIEEALYLADRIVVMRARPSRVTRIIDVPFGRPRDGEHPRLRRDGQAQAGDLGRAEVGRDGRGMTSGPETSAATTVS